jgi:poly(A) polymerase/tRNA nucleotidyltransferase (CCA-adding enzyme)
MEGECPLMKAPTPSPSVAGSALPLNFKVPNQVMEIIQRLRERGFSAFLVGGAIRDALLGRVSSDWDVATDAPTERVTALFPRVIPTGIRHGTVTVLLERLPVEVTTFRGDGIVEDLRHRDFTINALAWDVTVKRLLDPFGGVRDLGAGWVRGVDDPRARLHEDPLRAMRALRIAAELDFRIHPKTRAAIPHVTGRLRDVSPERIREELNRLLLTGEPSGALRAMRRTGIMAVMLPELMEGHGKRQGRFSHRHTILEHAFRTVDHLPPRPVLRWAALLHDVAKPRVRQRVQGRLGFPEHAEAGARVTEAILERLRFSRREMREIVHLVARHEALSPLPLSEAAVRRLVLEMSPDSILDLVALRRADRVATGLNPPDIPGLDLLEARIRALLNEPNALKGLRPVLHGSDVMEILGIPPGPRVGEIMRALRDLVVQDPSLNQRERLRSWLLEHQDPWSP